MYYIYYILYLLSIKYIYIFYIYIIYIYIFFCVGEKVDLSLNLIKRLVLTMWFSSRKFIEMWIINSLDTKFDDAN